MFNRQKNGVINWGRSKRKLFFITLLLASGLFGCNKPDMLETATVVEDGKLPKEAVEETTAGQAAADQTTADQVAADKTTADQEKTASEKIYVHICGAVLCPGVYELSQGARIYEAIRLAGGMKEEACGEALNQAEVLADEQKLYVPTVSEWEKSGKSGKEIEVLSGPMAGGEQKAESAQVSGAQVSTDEKININTADRALLCTLPGVGETRAEAIIAFRSEHGAFQKIEDIMQVPGIKDGLFSKIRDHISV